VSNDPTNSVKALKERWVKDTANPSGRFELQKSGNDKLVRRRDSVAASYSEQHMIDAGRKTSSDNDK